MSNGFHCSLWSSISPWSAQPQSWKNPARKSGQFQIQFKGSKKKRKPTFQENPNIPLEHIVRPPQTPKWNELLHKLLIPGLGYFQGYVGKILRSIEPGIWHLEIQFGNQHFQVGGSFNIKWNSFIQNHLRKRTVIPGTFSWDLQEKQKVNLGNLVNFQWNISIY